MARSILRHQRFTQWCRDRLPVIPHEAALAIPGTYHASGLIAKGLNPTLSVFALEGQPSQVYPLKMPYLGVAPGCTCAALLVVCVEHLAYSSVLVTPTTCVRFIKSRDKA